MKDQATKAIATLKNGGVIVFPTDTVWGIGAALNSKQGIEKLYQIKKRQPQKPTALLVSDTNMANRYGVMNKLAWDLASKFWPGALTLVVTVKVNEVSKTVTGGTNTVGLRVPDHILVTNLIKNLDQPLVAASANFASLTAPITKQDLDPYLVKLVDFVLDGESSGQPSSTVVDVTGDTPRILRRGPINI